MKTVGIRELKNRLSEYLRIVRTGETVLVTDRGEVIAEINAPGYAVGDRSMPAGLVALARRGLLTVGAASEAGTYPALRRSQRRHSAAKLLNEERGSR